MSAALRPDGDLLLEDEFFFEELDEPLIALTTPLITLPIALAIPPAIPPGLELLLELLLDEEEPPPDEPPLEELLPSVFGVPS